MARRTSFAARLDQVDLVAIQIDKHRDCAIRLLHRRPDELDAALKE